MHDQHGQIAAAAADIEHPRIGGQSIGDHRGQTPNTTAEHQFVMNRTQHVASPQSEMRPCR